MKTAGFIIKLISEDASAKKGKRERRKWVKKSEGKKGEMEKETLAL